jgi:hypothetical protein
MHRSANLGKTAQLRRALRPVESIPGIAADTDIARQAALQIPEPHRSGKSSDIADDLQYARESLRSRVNRENQKNGGLRQRSHNTLRFNGYAVHGICHRIDLT